MVVNMRMEVWMVPGPEMVMLYLDGPYGRKAVALGCVGRWPRWAQGQDPECQMWGCGTWTLATK